MKKLLIRCLSLLVFLPAWHNTAYGQERTYMYVVDLRGDRIEAIDLATNLTDPAKRISVVDPRGIALSSVDNRIYVAALDTFHIFGSDGEALSKLPLFLSAPITGDFNFDGSADFDDFLLLAAGFNKRAGQIGYNSILDLNSDTVVNFQDFLIFVENFGQRTPPVDATRRGSKVVLSSDESHAFITEESADRVKIVELATLSAVASVATGQSPSGVATSPTTSLIYAADRGSSITVVDATQLKLKKRMALGGLGNARVAVSPDGSRVYAARSPDPSVDPGGITTIQVIGRDAEENTLIDSVTVGRLWDLEFVLDDQVIDLRLSGDGSVLYATVQRSVAGPVVGGIETLVDEGALIAIDTETFEVTGDYLIGNQVGQFIISPDGTTAYVVAIESFLTDPFLRIFIVDLTEGQKLGSLSGFDNPVEFGFRAQRPTGVRPSLSHISLF